MVVGGSRESLVHGGALDRAWGHFEVPILGCKNRPKATKRQKSRFFGERGGAYQNVQKSVFAKSCRFGGENFWQKPIFDFLRKF